MKFLCLAYGAEKDWNSLSKSEQSTLLAHDSALREEGALMGVVDTHVTTVRAWDGSPDTTQQPVAELKIPFAGFSIIDADSLEAVIEMVARTPCARAKGAIEIRTIKILNDEQWKSPSR